jgi:hypothetical protein
VLFRRDNKPSRTGSAQSGTDDQAESVQVGKGRPTPSRKEAEAARKARAKPPLNRRDASRADRQSTREQRLQTRQALISGDERALPARDRGPVRRFARDYVDSRRTLGELMLPSMILFIPLTLGANSIANVTVRAYVVIATYLYMLMMIGGTAMLARRVKTEAIRQFPNENVRGAGFYAAMRSLQLRRWRLPKPRLKAGDPL